MKKRIPNEIPQVPVEYAPETVARLKEQERQERKRDARYKNASNDLIIFSENYKTLKADEVKNLMRIPHWRETFNEAARKNLI